MTSLARSTTVEVMLSKTQLKWVGHMTSLEDYHLLMTLIFRELQSDWQKLGHTEQIKSLPEKDPHLLYIQLPSVQHWSVRSIRQFLSNTYWYVIV